MYPAFIDNSVRIRPLPPNLSNLPIDEKMAHITRWLQSVSRIKTRYMLYMIMYDIENNKIRTHIAKYLIRKGCMRIQKSVYLAKGSRREMEEISEVLFEINGAYENQDSIFILPIPQEKFNNMRVIGKNMSFEIVTKPRNVLIF